MALRIRPNRRQRRMNALGIAMIAASALVIVGLGVIWLVLPEPPCRQAPTALYAVLIDATSTLSDAQRLDLSNRLRTYMREMPAGAQVQFWQVAPTGRDVPTAMAEPLCKPDLNPNAWVQNERRAAQASAKFDEATSKHIAQGLTLSEQPESPLLESVQAIWLRYLGSDAVDRSVTRRLIVASDLIQHTEALSFYRALPTYDQLRNNPRYQALRVSLSGTEVEVLFLKRDDGIDAGQLIELWQSIVDGMQGTLNTVVRITG